MNRKVVSVLAAIVVTLAVIFSTPVGVVVVITTGVVSIFIPNSVLNPSAAFVVSFLMIFLILLICILFFSRKYMRRIG